MRELSLFTGAGGGVLGSLLLGHEIVGYVEFEGYPQAVLASHIRRGHLDSAPVFGDVRAFASRHARKFAGRVDLVSAGFPCPPFSVAGKRQGAADARNMWPATASVLRAVRPPVAFLENVPGLLSVGDGAVEFGRYFGTVLGDLAALGFDAEWTVLGAANVGAPHQRDRLWILAFSDAGRELLRNESEPEPRRIGARDRGCGCAETSAPEDGPALPACGPGGDAGRSEEELADSDGIRRERIGARGEATGRAEPTNVRPVVADSDSRRCLLERQQDGQPGLKGARGTEPDGRHRAHVEHTPLPRLEGGGKRLPRCGRCAEDAGQSESGLGRGPHGLADRLVWPASRGQWPAGRDDHQHGWEPPRVLPRGARTDFRRQRLRAIGNGQVPACVVAAWRELVGRAVEG